MVSMHPNLVPQKWVPIREFEFSSITLADSLSPLLSSHVDVWSAGCVLAELLLGQPIFPGDSGVDQLVEIIKVLGTPTREQIKEMNPHYTEFKFPQIKPHPWNKVARGHQLVVVAVVTFTVHF